MHKNPWEATGDHCWGPPGGAAEEAEGVSRDSCKNVLGHNGGVGTHVSVGIGAVTWKAMTAGTGASCSLNRPQTLQNCDRTRGRFLSPRWRPARGKPSHCVTADQQSKEAQQQRDDGSPAWLSLVASPQRAGFLQGLTQHWPDRPRLYSFSSWEPLDCLSRAFVLLPANKRDYAQILQVNAFRKFLIVSRSSRLVLHLPPGGICSKTFFIIEGSTRLDSLRDVCICPNCFLLISMRSIWSLELKNLTIRI